MTDNTLTEPWNRTASEYANVFDGLVTQGVEPTLNAAEVARGCKVLDVATGPGIIAGAAVARGADAVGLDFAENMIGVARTRYPAIKFEVADAQDLPFEGDSFDAVVMGFALFMLPDPYKALSEAFRVLRPGGKFSASVWDQPLPAFDLFYSVLPKYIDEEMLPGGPPLNGVADRSVLASALQDAGFADVIVESLPIVWEMADSQHLINAMGTLRDFSQLSDDHMAAFVAEIVEGATQWEKDGRFYIPNPALILSGIRN